MFSNPNPSGFSQRPPNPSNFNQPLRQQNPVSFSALNQNFAPRGTRPNNYIFGPRQPQSILSKSQPQPPRFVSAGLRPEVPSGTPTHQNNMYTSQNYQTNNTQRTSPVIQQPKATTNSTTTVPYFIQADIRSFFSTAESVLIMVQSLTETANNTPQANQNIQTGYKDCQTKRVNHPSMRPFRQ
jgi:hypothetical protein